MRRTTNTLNGSAGGFLDGPAAGFPGEASILSPGAPTSGLTVAAAAERLARAGADFEIATPPAAERQAVSRLRFCHMIKAAFQTVINAAWTKLEPIRVGAISTGLGTPDIYVLVEDDGSPLVRIDVYAEEADHTFQEVIVWEGFVVIGAWRLRLAKS